MNMIVSPSTPVLHPWLPQSFEQVMVFAEQLANSGLVPVTYRNKPSDCLVAMQFGASLGLHPLQAIQNIAVINGRPCLWGDAALALVRASGVCESIIETHDGDTAICTVKRRGETPQRRTFSQADAQRAGLLNKAGPWRDYPARMRQLRARGFALRDVFPDVLSGLSIAEEVRDTQIIETSPAVSMITSNATPVSQPALTEIIESDSEPPLLPQLPQKKLEAYLPTWQRCKNKDADHFITLMQSKYRLSDAQKAQIHKALAIKTEDAKPETVVAEALEK